jgi:PAS domain S-box-containing protein
LKPSLPPAGSVSFIHIGDGRDLPDEVATWSSGNFAEAAVSSSEGPRAAQSLADEVVGRLGVLPSFFDGARAGPELVEPLWAFAKSAYLDSPLPSIFKERLFVHLSRFCPVRYCIVRHVGFLIGEGRPSGDGAALPHTVEEVLALLRRPVPDRAALERAASRLVDLATSLGEAAEPPAAGTQEEADLFDVLTVVFLVPLRADSARTAVHRFMGAQRFEILTAFLAFVRTAHYWTKTHPDLAYEPDMLARLAAHGELARRLLDPSEAHAVSAAFRRDEAGGNLDRADEALRESELRSRMLVEGIAQATWEADGSGVVVADSPSWRAFTGQSREQWLGHGWADAVHPEDRSHAERQWREAVAVRRDFNAEFRLRHAASGGYRWTNVRAVPVMGDDGAIVKWLGMNIDIDERKRAESSLREREADLARAQRIGQVGGIDIDVAHGLSSRRSPEYLSLHGLPEDGRVETHEEWLARVHPDDRERAEENLFHALDSDASGYDSEYRIVRPSDGAVRWIHVRADIERDAARRPLRLVGAHVDITEQKRLQEALLEADRRKDEFLAMLAHELRNPLATICNGLHLVKRSGGDPATMARVQDMMGRQAKQLVRLVDDLMEVSRITRGKITLRRRQIDVDAAVYSAVEASRSAIDARGHRLGVELPEQKLVLNADPVRLVQILTNLLNNAAKYTDKGGDIVLTVRREDAYATFSVRDTGVGIPAEQLPHVFDLFIQLHTEHGRAQGGLGIGLTLVRSLAELHGGSVEARSDGPGRGSEFIVRLPLDEPETVRGDAAQTAGEGAEAMPQCVVVVDDNHDAADSLAIWFRDRGVEVHTAYDGPTALDLLRKHCPTLMVLDLGMPGMDGFELARRARQLPEGRRVQLIALTGWGQDRHRRLSREAGIDHHLMKPVDFEALQVLMTSRVPDGHGAGSAS